MNRILSTSAATHLRHLHLRHLRQLQHPPDHHRDHILLWRSRQILDPEGFYVNLWNHIFLVSCLLALFVDPLYFFLPYVGGAACFTSDVKLGMVVTILRSIADVFYVIHVVLKFRTAYVAPSSRVFGKGDLVMDPRQIANRYLKSDFVIDLAAALPLPQFMTYVVIPATKNNKADYSNNTIVLLILLQYIPRLFLIFPLNKKIIKTTGLVARIPWAGAAYNLLLYMLASHVLGAAWYLLSIGRQHECWKLECANERYSEIPCFYSYLDCNTLFLPERVKWVAKTRVIDLCDAKKDDSDFKFGMFANAFTTEVASSTFYSKYLYCLWWGLRNLSSYGQNLETSIYVGETTFCLLICVAGLILFAELIGQMQTYLQSLGVRLEEWRIRRRDTEEWMRHRQLPPELQKRVRRFVQYTWLATRGVKEESILQSLPIDLRREIQRHLCLQLVRRVPFFSQMDDQLLDAICERLTSSLSTQGTYIVREDDPVNEMLFVIRGQLESSTTNGGRSGFFNSITLRPGDFCGEELLTWALMPNSSLNLPSSTRTVRTLTEVEAFALRAEDLKIVANQFKRLHSKKLQHAFRYYSHQWRTWGACFIESAWRRYKKKKMAKDLVLQESSYYGSGYNNDFENRDYDDDGHGNENAVQHLGATILASKFAANTRRGANGKGQVTASEPSMPKLFKPDEPDFSLIQDDN